jgi:hypothetical protein
MTNHKERAIAPKQGKRLHMDRSLRKMSRQIRRIFMEYPAEINRSARIIGEERKDLAGQLLITGSEILRLRQR